ncbi:putative transcription factor MADS-type1 family [Medicago truncatula]|uniref:MADS-box transcription factor family protein n=2 Tax=Medicago truncatula TaxID=3880 RepID=A0A072V8A1_MEDTR|nr:MADS-box transcription factor family protein [Medicago truncatula]RHN67724.1 putative transcription factor MADS-type1 family [Medicago truncatula]
MKKINEISTLCGVEACAIISEQNNPRVEVWPSDSGVRSVISRFRSLPGYEQCKKMVDQEVFLKQSIGKVYEQLKKQREETRKMEMTNIIDHYIQTIEFNGNSMSKSDLNDFSSFIDENLKEVNLKMKEMTIKDQKEVGNGVGL